MARTISIGAQGFAELREQGCFYVDKTGFIRDWWRGADVVTLVCRPRRFGKTLGLSTAECFLSTRYAGRGEELFGGLEVWDDPKMRALQGTVPTVFLSFANCKGGDFATQYAAICRALRMAVRAHDYLLDSDALNADDRAALARVSDDMDVPTAASCLQQLCLALKAHWGVAPVVLLDEYDTPMQEAWVGGWWDEVVDFQRLLFNSTFKTNPALGRGLITGVTRVSRESIFSDLNNLTVVTTFSGKYATAFGFTEDEVFAALDEYGMGERREDVRRWYDGFTFGRVTHVYNPWSVTNYLEAGELRAWWANTSSNSLVSTLVRTGDAGLKDDFASLLEGQALRREVDDEIAFSQLSGGGERAVWSLLLASGYLRADDAELVDGRTRCDLALTNREVLVTFRGLVSDWFGEAEGSYNAFVRALLAGDAEEMGDYLCDVALATMSSFDSGRRPSARTQPERFWHGLVLGLLVDLRGRYVVRSNPESGYGRCDVLLTPLDDADPAVIIEFKVVNRRRGEQTLEDAVASALAQIARRAYAADLVERGIEPGRIHRYGIAFDGTEVLVGS